MFPGSVVCQDVNRGGIEHEPECLLVLDPGACRLSWGWLAVVGHFRESVALVLGFGLEAKAAADDVIVRDLKAVVERLAHGPTNGVACLGPVGLEEVKLAAVMCGANHCAAVCVADAEGVLGVERPEAGILQLATWSLHIQRKATSGHGTKAVAALSAFDHTGGSQFGVVAATVGFEPCSLDLRPIGRRGQLGGDDIHDAAECLGAIEDAGWPPNDFNSLRETRVERRSVLVAPGVILQPAAIGEHEHTWAEQPADHRLAHLLA